MNTKNTPITLEYTQKNIRMLPLDSAFRDRLQACLERLKTEQVDEKNQQSAMDIIINYAKGYMRELMFGHRRDEMSTRLIEDTIDGTGEV